MAIYAKAPRAAAILAINFGYQHKGVKNEIAYPLKDWQSHWFNPQMATTVTLLLFSY